MHVIKRSGKAESVQFDKIANRIKKLCCGLSYHLSHVDIAKKVIAGIYDGIATEELDNLAAETAATMSTMHPDYAQLAARISTSNLHKTTSSSFSNTIGRLYKYINPKTGEHSPLVSRELYELVKENANTLDSIPIYERDFDYDYFGFKTLERSYLIKIDGKVVERPQQMLLRVSLGIHGKKLDEAIKTYHLMSNKWFIHATPTLFNSGTPKPQLSSCFLLTMEDDSIEGIYNTLKKCAKISQNAGGIGLSIQNIRSRGSYIKGTGGSSNGIVPMLRNFDMTARYVDQGGGRRKGAFAIYIEPWHGDIFDFLDLKKNHGKEEQRARDLFYALWIPDLFMERVKADKDWSLFSPNEAKGLIDCYGKKFRALYESYERAGKATKTVKARKLWQAIVTSQIETGTPYMLYKDACNEKSNQKNLGTLRGSNLCTEILEYTSKEEVAVCNLASLSLPKFIKDGKFDHNKLFEVTAVATKNLNKVIDINFYPLPEAKYSNLRHRPIGIGVQGLADTFLKLRMPFDSQQARQLNKEIFETIYYAALYTSNTLAKSDGTYESYEGSPISQGSLQFDLWNSKPVTKRWDWLVLREKIAKYGLRNSLLLSPMPTASTSQIMGNNECFEPYTSNIYVRRVLSGEFIVVNKHLLKDLIELGLWNDEMKNELIKENGSVQNIAGVPEDIKKLYRTVWEIPQKSIIEMAADRAIFICQTQSLNLHISSPTYKKITSMHFYAWEKGLKTGMYYLRTKAAVDAIKFTVAPVVAKATTGCSIEGNTDECLLCSS